MRVRDDVDLALAAGLGRGAGARMPVLSGHLGSGAMNQPRFCAKLPRSQEPARRAVLSVHRLADAAAASVEWRYGQ